MEKTFTELSRVVADEIMELHKVVDDLSIFPEKATTESLNKVRARLARLIDPANRIVSTASHVEDNLNKLETINRQMNNTRSEIAHSLKNYPLTNQR